MKVVISFDYRKTFNIFWLVDHIFSKTDTCSFGLHSPVAELTILRGEGQWLFLFVPPWRLLTNIAYYLFYSLKYYKTYNCCLQQCLSICLCLIFSWNIARNHIKVQEVQLSSTSKMIHYISLLTLMFSHRLMLYPVSTP